MSALQEGEQMIERLRSEWRTLRQSPPGKRFQASWVRRHQEGGGKLGTVVNLAVGVVILAVGIFFLPAPGPGTLVVALALALIARESRRMSGALDAFELKLRRLAGRAQDLWSRSGALTKGLLVLLGLVIAAGAGYGSWRLLFN